MQYFKHGKRIELKSLTRTLPLDLHWKVYHTIIKDLGQAGEHPALESAIRSRDIDGLFSCLGNLEPPSILDETGLHRREHACLFYKHYQLGALLKKYPFSGQDTTTPALETFKKAEAKCGMFNRENFQGLEAISGKHPDFLGIIEEIQNDICFCLGERPSISYVLGHAQHGPGVSLDRGYKKGRTTSYYKWSTLPYSVTSSARPLAKQAILEDPRWIGALDDHYRERNNIPKHHRLDMTQFWDSVLAVNESSRIALVPKSYKTDRTIAIEPALNVYLQLGVDRLVRSQLRKKWGYDIDDQQPNQALALEGSLDGAFATIDLSMASDTISLKLCEMLLPPEWYSLLLDLRCPSGQMPDGQLVEFEKLSSMGNGFTFAIETLIFGALTRCAIRRTKSLRKSVVYGDDIVVPSTAAAYLVELLNLCGFAVNTEKSFVDGPFRESCGEDYYLGNPVRPFFLKRTLTDLRDLFYVHNSLCTLEEKLPWAWEIEFTETKALILKYIPKEIRKQFYGPVSESLDTHLFSHRKLRRNQHGQRCYYTIVSVARRFNAGTSFFFRKLQVKPFGRDERRGEVRFFHSLFKKTERVMYGRTALSTGNAFDVTRRDAVHIKCTRVDLP